MTDRASSERTTQPSDGEDRDSEQVFECGFCGNVVESADDPFGRCKSCDGDWWEKSETEGGDPDVELAKERLRAAHRTNRQYAEEDLLTMARIVQAYAALGGDPEVLRGGG